MMLPLFIIYPPEEIDFLSINFVVFNLQIQLYISRKDIQMPEETSDMKSDDDMETGTTDYQI